MRLKLGALIWVGVLLSNGASGRLHSVLTSAAEVKRLSMDEASTGQRVVLRGIVTQVVPEWWGLSLQDGTEGIYVATRTPLPEDLRPGQAVVVEGRTSHGNFAPAVKADSIRILGTGLMPVAERVNWQRLATGSCDNEYVEVQGVVRSAGSVGPPAWEWQATALRLDIGGNFIWAYMRGGEALPREPLVDATVRLRGVCLVFTNSQRQFQGTVLTVPRAADLKVLQAGPQDPFEAPLQPIRMLFVFSRGSVSFHRVKVQGIATLQVPGGVYLQQGREGLLVRAASAPHISPGDRVEAVGFPAAGGFSTVLEDGLVRVTGHGGPEPAPRDVPADRVLARIAHAPAVPNTALVRVTGRLLDRASSAEGETLLLADGDTNFGARLRPASGALDSLQPGSRVAVRGVCTVHLDDRGLPQSFELLMRSAADVQVLQHPPWLSRSLALRIAAALLAFLIAAVVGLALLRRQVSKQTETIRRQFEREASLAQRYSDLVENASDLVYVRDLDGRLLQANRGAQELTGYTREELLGSNVLDLLIPEERERARRELAFRPGLEATRAAPEWRFLTKDGHELIIETKERFLIDNGQSRVECIGRDVTVRHHAQQEAITERDRLQEQLHHSQKLESLGQLAGGVAHDFNNLLTIIAGYAQMVLGELRDGDPLREPIDEIAQAADRASGLTRQLLLFSRRQTASPKIISLNALISNLDKMLRRMIGEDIRLMLSLEARGGSIHADPGLIEQVVMNLMVNARDAMPDGGSLTIRTGDFHVDERYASQHLGVVAGDYVVLDVTDTGVGIDPEVRSRIFEPFFTTKEQGKGTGLGLSTVYGIVKQSGGAIFVYSEAGRGSKFEIMFPAAQDTAGAEVEPVAAFAPASGAETILVAEDEAGVRSLIRDALCSHGYTVLEAANGWEALESAAQYPGPIHLLLTDSVMPEMGGVTLAERFRKLRPGTPVLHMSGYTDHPLGPPPEDFLQKPFTPSALLDRIRASLNSSRAGEA